MMFFDWLLRVLILQYIKILFCLVLTVIVRFLMDPDFSGSDQDFWLIWIRTREKKSDPDPDKRNRTRNTGGKTRNRTGNNVKKLYRYWRGFKGQSQIWRLFTCLITVKGYLGSQEIFTSVFTCYNELCRKERGRKEEGCWTGGRRPPPPTTPSG